MKHSFRLLAHTHMEQGPRIVAQASARLTICPSTVSLASVARVSVHPASILPYTRLSIPQSMSLCSSAFRAPPLPLLCMQCRYPVRRCGSRRSGIIGVGRGRPRFRRADGVGRVMPGPCSILASA